MGILSATWRYGSWESVHRDQLASLVRATPAAMIGYGVNVALATIAFWNVLPAGALIVWAGSAFALCGWIGIRAHRTVRRHRQPQAEASLPMRSGRSAFAFGFLLALPWAVLPTVWVGHVHGNSEVVLMALAVGMAASGSILLAPIPVAAVIYVATILVPLVVKMLVVLESNYLILGALAVSYLAFLLGLIATNARLFKERLDAVAKLQDTIAALSQSREETERAAMTDGLTGLANRRAFVARLSELDSSETKNPYSIFYVDLDRFKPVNDTLGHAAGDSVLAAAAARIVGLVRPTDMVARLGGDEFAIIALGSMNKAAATLLAERLRHALAWPFAIDGQRIEIGCSIGVAIPSDASATGEDLLKQADLAMYAAKDAGRGSFSIFESDMQRSAEERQVIEAGLKTAIANREFELYYQPIRRLATDAISGFECLIRWHHPTRGMLLPAQFLGIAGEIGLADQIADWVLEEACHQAAQWPSRFVVGINLCPLQIQSGDIAAKVERVLQTSTLTAAQLELEITETSLLQSDEETLASLRRLRDLGVSIALDDFGTGFSSLSYLISFPFNRIKIDRLFVSQLGRCRESDLIVRSIAQLAKNLNCTVVAEGIETGEQYRRLRALHVSHGQGYLLGEPLTANDASMVVASECQKATVLAHAG